MLENNGILNEAYLDSYTIGQQRLKERLSALSGVAQALSWTANQRVAGSILSQGTCVDCGPGSQLGACERQ